MIVFCEECGAKNEVDPEKIGKVPLRCENCNDILRIPITSTNAPQEQKSEMTAVSPPSYSRLELRYRDHIVEISQTRPSVTMGRQSHNNLVVEDNRASRSHARIVLRKDEFVLIDHSTNGTYVFMEGKKGVNLKQNELSLEGTGVVGLGRKVTSDSPEAIHFIIYPT